MRIVRHSISSNMMSLVWRKCNIFHRTIRSMRYRLAAIGKQSTLSFNVISLFVNEYASIVDYEQSLLHFNVIFSYVNMISYVISITSVKFSMLFIKKKQGDSYSSYSTICMMCVVLLFSRRLMEEDDDDALSEIEPDSVPNEVRDWLAMTFTRSMSTIKRRVSEKPKFKSVAQAIRAGIMVDRFVQTCALFCFSDMSSDIYFRYLRRLSIDIKFKVSK
jgi:hypothetical protein